jgi:excisionase family DNA binding protein
MPRVPKQADMVPHTQNRSERWKAPPSRYMLSPQAAWRALCRRTGAGISRATFYRWIDSGKLYSVRLGFQIYVPQMALDDLVKQCLEGERF